MGREARRRGAEDAATFRTASDASCSTPGPLGVLCASAVNLSVGQAGRPSLLLAFQSLAGPCHLRSDRFGPNCLFSYHLLECVPYPSPARNLRHGYFQRARRSQPAQRGALEMLVRYCGSVLAELARRSAPSLVVGGGASARPRRAQAAPGRRRPGSPPLCRSPPLPRRRRDRTNPRRRPRTKAYAHMARSRRPVALQRPGLSPSEGGAVSASGSPPLASLLARSAGVAEPGQRRPAGALPRRRAGMRHRITRST